MVALWICRTWLLFSSSFPLPSSASLPSSLSSTTSVIKRLRFTCHYLAMSVCSSNNVQLLFHIDRNSLTLLHLYDACSVRKRISSKLRQKKATASFEILNLEIVTVAQSTEFLIVYGYACLTMLWLIKNNLHETSQQKNKTEINLCNRRLMPSKIKSIDR